MIHRFLFRGLIVLGFAAIARGEPIRITPFAPAETWHRVEFKIENAPTSANNFDPDLIKIDGTFTAPSGKTASVPAFWFQDFNRTQTAGAEVLTAKGSEDWRLRFTPTEVGDYTLSLSVQTGADPAAAPTVIHFSVVTARREPLQHWVQNTPDARGFQTSDGKPLHLVGENICWSQGHGTYDFDTWFNEIKNVQGNFARVWLCPWSLGLEHTPNTLNHYRQKEAWQLDHVFEQAEHDGIYLMLCLDHHGMYQSEKSIWDTGNSFWKSNPYNQLQGGPCVSPNDFFTNPLAKTIYQKRLRYLIGRYGDSPALLAWEFFNEIDNVYQPHQALVGPDVAAWHQVMGQWLHAHDPYHHLVSTSLTGGSDRPEIWSLPEIDFTMYHSYGDPAPARVISALTQDFLQRYKKPVLIGEFGVSAGSWDLQEDPHLRGFRQLFWSGALGGSVGTSMSWWWESLHDEHVYPIFQSLTSILNHAGWQVGTWAPIAFQGNTEQPHDLGEAISDSLPFNASIALGSYRRKPISDEAVIANPLAAARASENLSSFLVGTSEGPRHQPMKLTALFGPLGKLSFRVNSVASDVELIVTVDGAEKLRTRIFDRDGQKAVNHEIDRPFSVEIPAGKHVIQISNTGSDWASLENLTLDSVKPTAFAGGWQYTAEKIGLRDQANQRAAIYVYSPYIAYPAGAYRYQPPAQENQSLTLPGWAAGAFEVEFYNAETGAKVSQSKETTASGLLTVHLPSFREDLAVVISPAE